MCRRYAEEARYFADEVRTAKEEELRERLQKLATPLQEQQFGALIARLVAEFEQALERPEAKSAGFLAAAETAKKETLAKFEEGQKDLQAGAFPRDAAPDRSLLEGKCDAHVGELRKAAVGGVLKEAEKKLVAQLGRRVADTLDEMPPNTWALLRELLGSYGEAETARVAKQVEPYGLGPGEVEGVEKQVREVAYGVLKQRVVEAAHTVGSRVKERWVGW